MDTGQQHSLNNASILEYLRNELSQNPGKFLVFTLKNAAFVWSAVETVQVSKSFTWGTERDLEKLIEKEIQCQEFFMTETTFFLSYYNPQTSRRQ